MSQHNYHPGTHTHGLNDHCPRCYEHSLHPFETLDDENMRQLTFRVVRDLAARSENERTAMNHIEAVIFKYRRLEQIGAL